jgi:hypothetical protein
MRKSRTEFGALRSCLNLNLHPALNHRPNRNLHPNPTHLSRFAVPRLLALIIGCLIMPWSATAQEPTLELPKSAARPDSSKHPEPTVPFSAADLEAAISRGTAYLCRTQNLDAL